MADITAPLRSGRTDPITWQEENTWLNAVESALNGLAVRCRSRFGVSVPSVSLSTMQDVCAPLTAAQHDANITAMQSALNGLLAASVSLGVNANNQVSLFTVQGLGGPLHGYHRDSNYFTVQVVCNTLDRLYTLRGF